MGELLRMTMHESDLFISYSTALMTKAFRLDPNTSSEGMQVDSTLLAGELR